MKTINISLPDKLKSQADNLIKSGYYASFSDLVRTAMREVMAKQPEIKNFSKIELSTPLGNG
jgi:Arc/MetJ-type ribon-helix-helix transcriptional regulator